MTITKEEFFKPGKISAQDKASATDHAAKQIVASEAAQRVQKTERLRQMREAQRVEADPPSSAHKKNGAVSGRA